MTDEQARAQRARGQLYGRRKGPKLREAQAELMQSLLPSLALPLAEGRDPRSYFPAPVEDVWLEVGFGGGEHLYALALEHAHLGFLGAEPFVNGVAKLLAKLQGDEEVQNRVRIHMGDAREIIDALPDASLGVVAILFPDPWPKTRHHKRRFIQMEMLSAIARVLRPGGALRFASDDPGYVAYALERLMAHPGFRWTAGQADDWRRRPQSWPPTRYEAKQIRGAPCYLCFVRR